MAAEDNLFGPGRQRRFSPYLAPAEREQLRGLFSTSTKSPPTFANELRSLARRYVDDADSLKLRTLCLLVADLCEQGWSISLRGDGFVFEPPGIARSGTESVDEVKSRVRQSLYTPRLRQLREPSVRRFLERMERGTSRHISGKASVLRLIDDGAELAREFDRIETLSDAERHDALASIIDPVIEVCEAGKRCADTGLLLTDVWRYFRHTWAHEYRPVPGRRMLLLIRNAARPRRPIMGIAMLASPVMRLAVRDKWIGWLRQEAEERLRSGSWAPTDFAGALWDRIDRSIASVRWDDLATKDEIFAPTETVALRLEQQAAGATYAREMQLREHYEAHREPSGRVPPYRGKINRATSDTDWRAASEDLLFVRKRAESLARLLFAKHVFCTTGLTDHPADALNHLFANRKGQRALDIALAEFRKAGLSSQVADVSICGAVQPYNQLLVGKLVALLLTSHEVREAYAARYGDQISVIASQMAGRSVHKPATLRVLTTTSLYGVGSSQYNRLALRVQDNENLPYDIKWRAIGKSLTGGFGTLHLGSETAHALRHIALNKHDARRINNRFGEGTSPRLRQIREGLDALGLKSDTILHHATPRLFYGCELGPESLTTLMGLGTANSAAPTCRDIAAAWRVRWLSNRIRRPETMGELPNLGPTSVRASLHAESDGQFILPIELE